MNVSTSGRPCIRQRVSWALQNGLRSLSGHNEQNGNRQLSRPGSAPMVAADAQAVGSGCPLAVKVQRCRWHSPRPALP